MKPNITIITSNGSLSRSARFVTDATWKADVSGAWIAFDVSGKEKENVNKFCSVMVFWGEFTAKYGISRFQRMTTRGKET